MAPNFRDYLIARGVLQQPQPTNADFRTGIPGGAAQAQALAQPNMPDPLRISDPGAGDWARRFAIAQAAAAAAQRTRGMGGGVPQSAMPYPQLVSRGPAYGSQAMRVAQAPSVGQPVAPTPPVPQAQDIRRFELNTQLPSGTIQPPAPTIPDREAAAQTLNDTATAWEVARLEYEGNPTPENKAKVDAAKAAYDEALVATGEVPGRSLVGDVFNALDKPRDLVVTEMGANAYDVATGKKDEWSADMAAIAPGNWMLAIPWTDLGLDQTRFNRDFAAWAEDPRNWQAIRYASENGFQAGENSPRFTGGRAVWELFINGAGKPYRILSDLLNDPTILVAGAKNLGGGLIRAGAEAAGSGRPMAATIYRGAGRGLSLPQDVLDVTVDAPFNAIGNAIGGTVRAIDGRRRPGKPGILDESLYDQSVESANTLDRRIEAYEGTRSLIPPAADDAPPPDGPMPPPEGPDAGGPGLYTIRETGPLERTIIAPDGSPYAVRTIERANTFNENVVTKEVEDLNRVIRRQQAMDAGYAVPERDLGWMDPNARSYDVGRRTDDELWFGRDIADMQQFPENQPFARAFTDLYYNSGLAENFKTQIEELSQSGANANLDAKAYVRAKHFAEDVLPQWKAANERAVAEGGREVPVPEYNFRHGDRLDERVGQFLAGDSKAEPIRANVVEHALFGSQDEAAMARRYLKNAGGGPGIKIGDMDARMVADELRALRKQLFGEKSLSQNPEAVRARARLAAQDAQPMPNEAALADMGIPFRSELEPPGGATKWTYRHIQSEDPSLSYRDAVAEANMRNRRREQGRDYRTGDRLPQAATQSIPTEPSTGPVELGSDYWARPLENGRWGLFSQTGDGRFISLGEYFDTLDEARNAADQKQLIRRRLWGGQTALPETAEQVIDQTMTAAPDMPPTVVPAPKVTPKGRTKTETMPWDPTLDDTQALRMASANVNWRTSTGNAIKSGQARTVYVEPRGGKRNLDRVQIRSTPTRDGDVWEVSNPRTGEVYSKETTLQDAIALADEIVQLIKKGMIAPDKKTLGIVSEQSRRLMSLDNPELLDDYGMVDGPGDTLARSADDASHVGLAHQIGKITAEDYDYLSQVVTYNDKPMRLWEAYEAALHDFRGDKTKAKNALVDQLVSPEVRAVNAEFRMTPAQRKAANAEKGKIKRALGTVLRGYDAWTNFYRQRIMFNWARGGAGILADQIERTYSLSLNREYRAALNSWDPRTIKRFLADERGKEKVLDAMESVANYRKVHGRNPPADWLQMVETRFMEGGNKNVAGEGLGWVYNATPLRATADPLIRDLRVSMDRHARYQLGMASWDRNLTDGTLRMRGLVRTQAERNGLDGDDAVAAFDRFVRDEGGFYNGQQVSEWAQAFGLPDGQATRLGRDWAEIANKASKSADERVRQLLFSYKMTNADNILRRGMLFHYWISRAAVLHARTTLQNPYLLNAYANAWTAMEREAEQNGYPPNIIGFTKLMQSELGMYALVSPANLLVPFFFLMEGAQTEDQDPGVLGFLKRWGGFINPQIEMAAAILGFHNRAPDITGTTAIRRAFRVTTNWLNNNGYAGIVPDALGEEATWQTSWFDQFVPWAAERANAGLRALTGGDNSPIAEFVASDGAGYEFDQIVTIMEDLAEADWGPRATWTEAQEDEFLVAQVAILSGSPGNDLSAQAIEAFSDEKFRGVRWTAITPGGLIQRYAPRDQDLINSRAGYDALDTGQDPTADQQAAMDTRRIATAGSPEDATLDAQRDRYLTIGTPRQQSLSEGWGTIVYNLDTVPAGSVISVGGRIYEVGAVKAMSEEERMALADSWVASHDGTADLESYRAERKQFLTDNPEYGTYEEWADTVRGYEGGPRQYRLDRAKGNPNFKRAMAEKEAQLKEDGTAAQLIPEELDAWSWSLAAYKATQGIKDSVYDPDPASTGDQSTVDSILRAQGGGGESSSKKSVPKTTAEKLTKELREYEAEVAMFDQILAGYGITGGFEGMNNPLIQGALRNQFGDLMPSQSKLLRTYFEWVAMMERHYPGADTSPAAFAAVMDRLSEEAAA